MSTSRKLLRAASLLAAVAIVAPAHAQTWSASAPAITASAKVAGIRQFSSTGVSLDFGTTGVTPGVDATVAPEATNAASGTGAKVDIRFNIGTKVTATVPATLSNGTTTVPISFSCAVADDQTGTNKVAFTTDCATGYEWLNASVTKMTTKSVLIGATILGTDSANLAAGTYTGNITLTLAASSS